MSNFIYASVFAALSLSGCAEFAGGPRVSSEYGATLPKVTRVQTMQDQRIIYFAPNQSQLSDDAKESMRMFLADVSPMSADAIVIESRYDNETRKLNLLRLMRSMGFAKRDVQFRLDNTLARDEMRMTVTYTVASTPDCPDWTQPSMNNHYNSVSSNARCATLTNLGHMVADPRDLQRGSGDPRPYGPRSLKAIDTYANSSSASSNKASSSAEGASAGATGASAASSSDSGSSGE